MIAIALLCLVAQLGELVHLLVVRHERCAEHGEVVHAAPRPSVESAPDAPTDAAGDTLAVVRSSSHASDDHHEHCRALTEVRALHSQITVHTVAIESVARVLPPGIAVSAATRPLFRLAPKLSPPTVA